MRFPRLILSLRIALVVLVAACLGACIRLSLLTGDFNRPAFVPPVPETWQLDNGLTVMFIEDRELPLVSGFLLLKGGGLWEPAGLAGVSDALGSQMRDGGAGALGAEALDQRLRDLSAEVSSSFGAEYGSVSFSSLSQDFPEVFRLMADVVLKPRFEDARLETWKARVIDGIRRREEDPEEVAGIASRQMLYGETPYGEVAVESDIRRLQRHHLLKYHRRFVNPREAILAVSGNTSAVEVRRLVAESFANWKQEEEGPGELPPLDFEPVPGIYFVKMPFEQATIVMGVQGVPRLTPDMIAIEIFNEVFGSGKFGSRLFKKVRTELGLSYSVQGGVYAGPQRGVNSITLQTKGSAAGQSIVESLGVLKDLQEREVPDTELANVKHVIENSFVFRFDSRAEIVRRRTFLKFLGYPPDYYDTYLHRVASVSPEEVQDVAKNRWDMDKFVVVVVGNENAYNSIQASLPSLPEKIRAGGVKPLGFNQRLIFE